MNASTVHIEHRGGSKEPIRNEEIGQSGPVVRKNM